jgi:hypothetical protein
MGGAIVLDRVTANLHRPARWLQIGRQLRHGVDRNLGAARAVQDRIELGQCVAGEGREDCFDQLRLATLALLVAKLGSATSSGRSSTSSQTLAHSRVVLDRDDELVAIAAPVCRTGGQEWMLQANRVRLLATVHELDERHAQRVAGGVE